jgi:transglutaminase-like putative cysteine protease
MSRMSYHVRHRVRLGYRQAVKNARLNLRLAPVSWAGQSVRDFSLTTDPQPDERLDQSGPYLVNVTSLAFKEPVQSLLVLSQFNVEVAPPPLPATTPSIGQLRVEAQDERELGALAPAAYLFGSHIAELDEGIGAWAAPHLSPDRPVLEAAEALCSALHREFAYDPRATDSRTLPAEAFAKRSGVCQDFAHILLVALRTHGIPAAYVSGYLRTLPPPGRPKLVGADAMHAWAAVWCGHEAGWIGLDPTNDCLVREHHIVVAMGRDYSDVAPVDGVFVGSSVQGTHFAVDVIELA